MAARRNIGRRKLAEFKNDVALLLGRETGTVDTVSLAETDEVFALFGHYRQRAENACEKRQVECLTFSDRQDAGDYLRSLALRFDDVQVLLFRAESQWCGAVQAKLYEVLFHGIALMSVDQEDLMACTKSGATGIFAASMSPQASATAGDYIRVVSWQALERSEN